LYLKKMSMYGFKSFAGRVELEFKQGIAGIVGPNGVGKSNISDAIRWAMGEQSPRILRGSRMQDVIFSGAAGRRPLGYAEVVLVFDNSDHFLNVDYDEVTVARRVYRSGESEYLLNGVQCRLRDVQDLFSGTGLGREAYSVVEQGKIDAVLSARPEDRRAVFDEAAGITKYRLRKRDAERRLVEVRADQLRVSDVAAEIARQLPVLRAQADQAVAWRGLSDELRQLELDLLCHDLARANAARTEAQRQIEAMTDRIHAAAASCAQAEAAAEAARVAAADAESRADALHSALGEARAEAERRAGMYQLARERLEAATQRCTELESELEDAKVQLAEAEGQRVQATEAFAECRAEHEAAQAEMAQVRVEASRARQEREAAESALDQAKARLFEVLSTCADLRSAKAAREAEARNRQARAERLTLQVQTKQAELAELERAGSAAAVAVADAKRRIDEAAAHHRSCLDKHQQAQARMRAAEAAVSRCNAMLASLEASYSSLAAIQRDYEGYGRAVRTLLADNSWKKAGLLGAVAELVTAPKEYEAAIEAALGSAVQNIVASTADVARRAVEELKRQRAGRATFLPLDILRPQRAAASEIPGFGQGRGQAYASGVVGLAADLVQADPAYRKVVDYLLGRVLVVDTLESGIRLARAGCRLRMATLDGDLISGAGAITGGERNDRQSGLIGRVRRLKELGEELQQARTQAAEAAAERERTQVALQASQKAVADAEDAVAAARNAQAEAARRLETVTLQAAAVREALSDLQLELDQLSGEAAAAVLEDIDSALAASAERQKELESEVARLTELTARQRRLEDECSRLNAAASGRLAAAVERLSSSRADLARAERRLAERGANVARLQAELAAAREDLARLESEVAEAEAAAAVAAARYEEDRDRLDHALAARAEATQAAATAEREVRSARRAESSLAEKLREASVEEARRAAEFESARERLEDAYDMDVQAALNRPPSALNRDDMCERIDALRAEMEAMGPINHTAPEEAAALGERYQFLTAQLQDLEEAQESLIQVIRECDRACTEQFHATFEQLRVEFSDIFTEIFGGGTADLVLEDPSRSLECGIEIVCQPPGKRLTRMSLLSGGEKSLVAIALLFAIMRVKPSPVCVFDEIDAALDEANLARFVEMLRSIARTVQVIIVTHRKRTMECADVLYGVTMEEQGVSKVFSLVAPSH